jgi:hypothetical protein
VPQDPETAGERLRATSLREKVSELEYLEARADGNVRPVERATPPDHRSSPTPVRNGLIAGFVAAVLGCSSSCCSRASTMASATRTSSLSSWRRHRA